MAETTKSADRSLKFWQLGGIFLVSIAFSVAASVLHFLANPIAGSYSVSYKLTHIPLRGVSVKLVRLDLERLFFSQEIFNEWETRNNVKSPVLKSVISAGVPISDHGHW